MEYGLGRRPAARAGLVGCGIKGMPNPPYISGMENFKYVWVDSYPANVVQNHFNTSGSPFSLREKARACLSES